MRILGIDCSSSTVGWAIIDISNKSINLVIQNHIKPLKKNAGSLIKRLDDLTNNIDKICQTYNPDFIVIEDILQFIRNRSTANTIITLAVFNRACAFQVFKSTNKEPIFMLPSTIRSKLTKYFKTTKLKKEDLPDLFKKKLNNFQVKLKQRGKLKGQPINEIYDEADAIAAAIGGAIKLNLI